MFDFMLTGNCRSLTEAGHRQISTDMAERLYLQMLNSQPYRIGFKSLCDMFPIADHPYLYTGDNMELEG